MVRLPFKRVCCHLVTLIFTTTIFDIITANIEVYSFLWVCNKNYNSNETAGFVVAFTFIDENKRRKSPRQCSS